LLVAREINTPEKENNVITEEIIAVIIIIQFNKVTEQRLSNLLQPTQ
jgi:hypothetical protein